MLENPSHIPPVQEARLSGDVVVLGASEQGRAVAWPVDLRTREPLGVQPQWSPGWIEFHPDTGVFGE